MKTSFLAALIPCALLTACGRTEPPASTPESTSPPPPAATTPSATAEATLAGPPANPAASPNAAIPASTPNGALQFTATSDGVQITGTVTGLAPDSEHGFHMHQTGDCSAVDFKSAGDHFNPASVAHGAPTADPHHLGDIPNLKADAQGNAPVNVAIAGATLRDGGPNDLFGKAAIVHAKPDDYTTQPSGDSGDRIACGEVR